MDISNRIKVKVIIIGLSTLFLFQGCDGRKGEGGQAFVKEKTVYDRVIKSGAIRCAYIVYPPSCIKDPNTGKLSGIAVETMEEAGKRLDLKVDWTEEVSWGTMIEGLKTNRYDIVVSGIWPSAGRAKIVDFTTPLFYSPIFAFARVDDERFNGDYDLNQPDIKLCTIDGEMSNIIADSDFPKAEKVSLPQLSDVSQLLLNVATKKGDITFVEPYFGFQYLEKNPGSVKNIDPKNPVRVFGNTNMLQRGQVEFKTLLNTTFTELINEGFVNRLVDQYEANPGSLLRRAKPFRISE